MTIVSRYLSTKDNVKNNIGKFSLYLYNKKILISCFFFVCRICKIKKRCIDLNNNLYSCFR